MYCDKIAGGSFKIDEWNKLFEHCNKNNIQGKERDKILHPDKFPCEEQCFNCMAIVGERRLKTQQLLNRKPNQ